MAAFCRCESCSIDLVTVDAAVRLVKGRGKMTRLVAAFAYLIVLVAAVQPAFALIGADARGQTSGSEGGGRATKFTSSFGACCLPDGSCAEGYEEPECQDASGGQFLGIGVPCPEDGCPDCDCDDESDITEITSCVEVCVDGGGDPSACAAACDLNDDGIPNACQDGSLDTDGDGAIGKCDGCAHDPDKIEPGICGCNHADVDSDADGIFDCNDACPNDPANDVDDDGVCGDVDNCPTEPNPDQLDADQNGVGDACRPCQSAAVCDDSNLCTNDYCRQNSCTHIPKSCPPDRVCDPATGDCSIECTTDAQCDDRSLCTYDDKCIDGFCFYKPIECEFPATCDPDTGECDGCGEPPGGCSDGQFCNGLEVFNADECTCDSSGDPCTDPSRPHCDEANDECVECLIDEHCDDGSSCTIDSCVGGVCDISPVECPENQGCDPVDGECRFCANTPVTMCCNPADGLMVLIDDDNACTEDICSSGGNVQHIPFALPPIAEAIATRSIAVTPQPSESTHPVALHLSSPNFPCLSRYLDAEGIIVDEPVFQTPADWGTVIATRQDIVPSATDHPVVYEFRAVCDPFSQDTTDAAQAVPYVWGDVNNDLVVDQFDILCVLDGFEGLFLNCPFVAVNLTPCIPDGLIDLFDILSVLDAFIGQPFPCASPCGGGACCEPSSTFCLELPEEDCDNRAWFYQGDGSHCRFNPCHP